MVGKAVAIPIKEHQIARLRDITARLTIKIHGGELVDPRAHARLKGNEVPVHTCVMQAEGHEHGAPVAVGVSVPVAVAGITVAPPLRHDKVPDALGVAKLRLGDCQHVIGPFACEIDSREGALPVCRVFHIGRGIAGFFVLGRFFLFSRLILVLRGRKAGLCMGMPLRFGKLTGQNAADFRARLAVRVSFGFLQSTGVYRFFGITSICMGMSLRFFKTANIDRLFRGNNFSVCFFREAGNHFQTAHRQNGKKNRQN